MHAQRRMSRHRLRGALHVSSLSTPRVAVYVYLRGVCMVRRAADAQPRRTRDAGQGFMTAPSCARDAPCPILFIPQTSSPLYSPLYPGEAQSRSSRSENLVLTGRAYSDPRLRETRRSYIHDEHDTRAAAAGLPRWYCVVVCSTDQRGHGPTATRTCPPRRVPARATATRAATANWTNRPPRPGRANTTLRPARPFSTQ